MPLPALPAGADTVVAGTLAPLTVVRPLFTALTLSRPLFTALAVARLLATLLGLVVAVQAFRGYRRNESRPMLYLAVGFALIGVRPLVTIPVARLLPPSEFALASYALDVAFLGTAFTAVLYSMHLIDSDAPRGEERADAALREEGRDGAVVREEPTDATMEVGDDGE